MDHTRPHDKLKTSPTSSEHNIITTEMTEKLTAKITTSPRDTGIHLINTSTSTEDAHIAVTMASRSDVLTSERSWSPVVSTTTMANIATTDKFFPDDPATSNLDATGGKSKNMPTTHTVKATMDPDKSTKITIATSQDQTGSTLSNRIDVVTYSSGDDVNNISSKRVEDQLEGIVPSRHNGNNTCYLYTHNAQPELIHEHNSTNTKRNL